MPSTPAINKQKTSAVTANLPSTVPQRRRAYSWRGESPPSYESSPSKATSDASTSEDTLMEKYIKIITQEARCVVTLVSVVALAHCSIALLLKLASFSYPLLAQQDQDSATTNKEMNWKWYHSLMYFPSIVAGCIIRVIPSKVISHDFPGFLYGSAWLLMCIKHRLGSFPHIPSRICEACLGRLTANECLIVVLTQMLVTLVTVIILQTSNNTGVAVLPALEYTSSSSAGNPWVVDYFHELFVNTIFTVTLQVVPVLLRLNKVSIYWTLPCIYPLYTYGVDRTGLASTLSPSILFALSCTRQRWRHCGRCIPQILSGVLAGKIMRLYFPDDSSIAKKRD